MAARRCKADTKSGTRCRATAVEGSDYCFAHEPTLAAKRAEWRRAGGRQSGRRAALQEAATIRTPEEVRDLLARTVVAVQEGTMDARTANTIRSLSNALLKAIKDTDLAQRLEALERAVAREDR